MTRSDGVIVVGAGNAALCVALEASDQGTKIAVLERAPEDESGGNGRSTPGAIRFAYDGLDDLLKAMPDLGEDEIATTDFGSYTEDDFFDDRFRVTNVRSDPDLVEIRVRRSPDTVIWMREKGVRPAKPGAEARGTRFNTGDGIRMALDIGAMPHGNWSGCHADGWERNAPEFGDLAGRSAGQAATRGA